jgi:hypothetical protein
MGPPSEPEPEPSGLSGFSFMSTSSATSDAPSAYEEASSAFAFIPTTAAEPYAVSHQRWTRRDERSTAGARPDQIRLTPALSPITRTKALK